MNEETFQDIFQMLYLEPLGVGLILYWVLHFLHLFTVIYGSLAALYGLNA